MKRLIFTAKALVDVEHILLFLADLHEELPLRFRIALQDHLHEIKQNPERWPPKGKNIRAGRLVLSRRLRYYVFYDQPSDREARILRLISQSADPANWPQ